MIKNKPLQYQTLSENQFWEFLGGQTHPAKFKLNDGIWVVRYTKDLQKHPRHNLRLASDLVGYRIAQKLGIPIPEFKVVKIGDSFKRNYFGQQKDEEIEIQASPATACKWLKDACYPEVRGEPLNEFWKEEYYLEIVARVRATDTWIMNFDRPRKGNIILTGFHKSPNVFFIDFDQSFLAKYECPIHRLHWSEEVFRREWLDDPEVLSGFDGTGDIKCKSVQRLDHFKNVVVKMGNISDQELNEILEEIPFEWEISVEARQRWLKSFLYRRNITISNIEKEYLR